MKICVTIGRTIPHPTIKYSTIRGDITIESEYNGDRDQALLALKRVVRHELTMLLQEEAQRAWDDDTWKDEV